MLLKAIYSPRKVVASFECSEDLQVFTVYILCGFSRIMKEAMLLTLCVAAVIIGATTGAHTSVTNGAHTPVNNDAHIPVPPGVSNQVYR